MRHTRVASLVSMALQADASCLEAAACPYRPVFAATDTCHAAVGPPLGNLPDNGHLSMADKLCASIHAAPELMVVQADVKRLESAVDFASGDVDVFLTCEWPSGVTAAVPPALLPPDLPSSAGAAGTGHLHALHLWDRTFLAGQAHAPSCGRKR